MASFNSRKRTGTGLSIASERSTRRARGAQEELDQDAFDHGDYTVGWICALPIEMAAAEAMLDAIHKPLPSQPHDSNAYTLGSIGPHQVVIACLPKGHYGTNNAATVATNMQRSFPSIEKRLLVGIGGGAPGLEDVRLGDIVVSDQVIQYDLGKAMPNGHFQRTSIPTQPPQALMTAVSKLQATYSRSLHQILEVVDDMLARNPDMGKFAKPDIKDQLYRSDYPHVVSSTRSCQFCDKTRLVDREHRQTTGPVIHFGKIASGNQVIKDGRRREELTEELEVICFEMEAAGLMDNFNCLVIRGICDYSDSHKNKDWQEHAAAVAAAYAKELLLIVAAGYPRTMPTTKTSQPREDLNPETTEERRRRLLNSLPFSESANRQAAIKTALKTTCEWFLSNPFYLDWLDPEKLPEHHGFLWISGKPGAGKSTIMKFLYSHTRQRWRSELDTVVVAFFFNARGADLEKSTIGLYRSLLFEILTAFPDLQVMLDDQVSGIPGREEINQIIWSLETLQRLFQRIVESLRHRTLICFIDALDECDDEQVRTMIDMFEELGETAFDNSTRLYICLSSRHYPHIEIQPCLRPTLEQLTGHAQDMEKYVRKKLKGGKSTAIEELSGLILQKAAGVFMWVILVVDILNRKLQCGRIATIKQYLQQLPSRLSELFEGIIGRGDSGREDLLLCIQWLLYAERPLTVYEFYCAMHSGNQKIPDGLVPWDYGRNTREQMELFVIDTSKGLAEVIHVQRHHEADSGSFETAGISATDEPVMPSSSMVQFIHESVRDFFLKDGGIKQLWPDLSGDAKAWSHDRLKECCCYYIKAGFSLFTSSGGLYSNIENPFPFLRYATDNTFYHADMAQSAVPQDQFLNDVNPKHWFLLKRMFGKRDTLHRPPDDAVIYMMYLFSESGLVHLLAWTLRQWCLRQMSLLPLPRIPPAGMYSHPLAAAIFNNKFSAVRVLLSFDILDADEFRKLGPHLLDVAVRSESDDILRELLDTKDFNLDLFGTEKLHWLKYADFVNREHERNVVKLLLAARDRQAMTTSELLLWAASQGLSVVVEELLIIGVDDSNFRDTEGRTAFWWAAALRKVSMAKRLIQSVPIDLNVSDSNGDTALSKAVSNSDVEMARFLVELEGSIDVNTMDIFGRTPLMKAIQSDYPGILIEMLLQTKNVDVNLQDKEGRTALSWVVSDGSCTETELLVRSKGVTLDQGDRDGKTPLHWAALSGISSAEKVTLLLSTGAVNADSQDNSGGTPLMCAAFQGNLYVVKLLVTVGNCDVQLKDEEEKTAMDWAKMVGQESIVRFFERMRYWL